jgi:hypothetical protein
MKPTVKMETDYRDGKTRVTVRKAMQVDYPYRHPKDGKLRFAYTWPKWVIEEVERLIPEGQLLCL